MIELMRKELDREDRPGIKAQRARELLQVMTLKIISDLGYCRHIAFQGGTALRLLYDLRRFSEDLDFSLVGRTGFDPRAMLERVGERTREWGLGVETKPGREKAVFGAWLRYPGLPKSLGLSPLAGQKLSIKLEVDLNPPRGGEVETSLISREFTFPVATFTLPSLFATKLHACFYRRFLKGRDFYDLAWYVGRRVRPNYTLLNNAIKQTQGRSPGIDEDSFKDFLKEKLRGCDLARARRDAEPFLFDRSELALFDTGLILGLVERSY